MDKTHWYNATFQIRHDNQLPLYKLEQQGFPDINGTGTLIRCNDDYYVITAAHVLGRRGDIASDSDSTICYVIDEPILVPRTSIRIAPNEEYAGEDVDIAVIRLEHQIAERIGQQKFLGSRSIQEGHSYAPKTLVVATGYPATRFISDYRERILLAQSTSYAGYLSNPATKRTTPKPRRTDIALEFNIKSSYKDGQEGIAAIKPNGISGGGIWVYQLGLKLIGIVTDYSKPDKLIIGTDISVALRVIKNWDVVAE